MSHVACSLLTHAVIDCANVAVWGRASLGETEGVLVGVVLRLLIPEVVRLGVGEETPVEVNVSRSMPASSCTCCCRSSNISSFTWNDVRVVVRRLDDMLAWT